MLAFCGCHGEPAGRDEGGDVPWVTIGPPSDGASEDAPDDTGDSIDPDDAAEGDEATSTDGEGSSAGESTSAGEAPTDPLPSCPAVRSEVDRPDDSTLPQIKVIYAVPLDGADAGLDTNGQICNSVRAWAGWFLDRSGGRGLRLDTAGGELDVAFVRLGSTDAQMHGFDQSGNPATDIAHVVTRIEYQLQVLGWLQPDTVYAVYYGGTSSYACGGGAWPPTLPGVVGAMYLGADLPGYVSCAGDPWGVDDMVPRYVDYGALHEVLHVLGFANGASPNASNSAHVWDGPGVEAERDMLFTPPPDGGTYPAWDVYAPGGLILDINNDDYFDHPHANLPDLGESAFLLQNDAGVHVPTCDDDGALAGCTDALAGSRLPIAVPPPPRDTRVDSSP